MFAFALISQAILLVRFRICVNLTNIERLDFVSEQKVTVTCEHGLRVKSDEFIFKAQNVHLYLISFHLSVKAAFVI